MLSKEEALKKARLMKCGFIGNVKVVASKDVNKLIREIYSANQCKCTELKWMPVEERLPKDDKDYLITDGKDMTVGFYRDDVEAWDNYIFGWIERDEDNECPCRMGKIIAWMPLPEPYRKEDSDE